MMKYTVHENPSFPFGNAERQRTVEDPINKPLKRPLGNRDQRSASKDAFAEGTEERLMVSLNVHGALRALEQLKLHRQESKTLSEEIINVYTEILQLDGACIYTYSAEGALEVIACNAVWSNIFSALQAAEGTDGRNILVHPSSAMVLPADERMYEADQASAIPIFLGMRNYGSVISLPLVCDGTILGAVSLFSVHPQFFFPERIDVFQMIASVTASLLFSIQERNVLEIERSDRRMLQQELQSLREHVASHQQHTDTSVEVKAAYDELEALSFSVSHDLRGPIIAIQNNCEWLSTQHAANLDAEGQAILQQIASSSDSMAKLLDGLLAFSKAVQLDPRTSLIDMTALVRTVIDELLKSDAGTSSLSIAIQPLIPAYGDPILIRQVWYNLLSNAFKYTRYKPKREVILESHPFNGSVQYCVRDNGVGFDMQYVDRLFGAFHRLHDAEEFEGTGVGLAIVQRIIRRHGGQVWAEGQIENGAQFYFTLPKTVEHSSDNR
jgi:signal transduction histidine kinase